MSPARTHDLLFELGCEEIPARMAPAAAAELRTLFLSELAAQRLAVEEVRTFVTPRRLALHARRLPVAQEDRTVERRGPARKAAFDAAGNPTKAALGFARGQGVDPSAFETMVHNGVEYVMVRKTEAGEKTLDLLPGMLERALSGLHFPKVMRWGCTKQAFIRPVQWILALFGDDVIPFEFAGIKAGRCTRGHRFHGPREPVDVKDFDQYSRAMAYACVVVDPAERRRIILAACEAAETEHGLELVRDEELFDQVVHLNEYPVPALGHFDEKYLDMPAEVLITSMKNHQKYFAFRQGGRLANAFLAVSNTRPEDPAVVVKGYQRVLAARLEDAHFFFNEDRGKPLADRLEKLAGQVFLKGLGSMKEKAERLAALAGEVAAVLYPDAVPASARSGLLAKADLATAMVGEFPELQGTMGCHYARAAGEPEDVCAAIEEHYLPRWAEDRLPRTRAGTVVALADRIDLLVGCFHLGLVPTPTKDPYALRRAALGSLRILAAAASNDDPLARVKVSDLVKKGIAGYRTVQMDAAGVEREVMEFLAGRLRNWLTADHSTEVVDACLAAKRPPGVEHEADFPYDVVRKVEAIETLRGRPDYEPLVIAFKRVVNITKGTVPGTFDPARVSAAEERALWEAFCAVRSALVARLDSREFPAALSLLIELKPHVDRYFDAVLVMCDDEAERNNHLAMLGIIGDLFLRLSDFTRILA